MANLPIELQDMIFLSIGYKDSDFKTLVRTRAVQSSFVKKCTEFDNMEAAIKSGNLANIKWLRVMGYPLDKRVFSYAVEFGNLNIVEWLCENTCPFDEEWLFMDAIRSGNLDLIQWLYYHHYPLGRFTLYDAVETGNLDLIKWILYSCGPDDDLNVFDVGIRTGNLNIVKLLSLYGYSCDRLSMVSAIKDSNLSIIKWLTENGCPWDTYVFNIAVRRGGCKYYTMVSKKLEFLRNYTLICQTLTFSNNAKNNFLL